MPDDTAKCEKTLAELIADSKRLQAASERISHHMDEVAERVRRRTEEFKREHLQRSIKAESSTFD